MRRDIHSVLGDRVREERKRAGLTMEKLAELAGISTSFLAYIETKRKKASLETVQKLADALRLSVADLFKTLPAPEKDPSYNAARTFAQLVREKSPEEISAVLAVANTALKGFSAMNSRSKRK